ncbi:hypothetical protein PIB30_055249 [Stylosanthes scabra]|uniref:Phytocyanin domain-containing protein n=1 Tax=Stylosanthes scabra TaxID=79078 RepID=A0ABU6WL08_9FABA|nr:hypothetical protein [Stylosanthes scabra]
MAIGSSMEGLVGLLLVVIVMSSASASTYNVGGRTGGWVVNPKENYTLWSQRYTFRVNDYLYFKYERGKDSVLIVSKQDYESCNTAKPLHRFRGGRSGSTVPLNKPGPFYVISGNQQNCQKGQKFAVNVVPAAIPPSPTTPAHSPAPSTTPAAPPQHRSPAPSPPPKVTPSHPPSGGLPASPADLGPVKAPAPAPHGNGASSRSFGVGFGVIISIVVALLF